LQHRNNMALIREGISTSFLHGGVHSGDGTQSLVHCRFYHQAIASALFLTFHFGSFRYFFHLLFIPLSLFPQF
jgi:hypothetical protein